MLARANVINHPASPRANFYYGNILYERLAQADALGLDDEEQLLLAVNARAYFERMHTLAPDAFPALVMLYQLDKVYFPKLALDNDWLAKIERLAPVKRLHASDRGSLRTLVQYSASSLGQSDRLRIDGIIGAVVARYPGRPQLLRLKYLMMAREPDISRETLRQYLYEAAARQGNRSLYALLLQNHGAEDMDLTYSLIGDWMQQDSRRRELPIVRRLFEP